VTITVRACFADTTTPTLVFRRKRRQPVTDWVAAAVWDTVAAARLRVTTVLRTAARGAAVAVAVARGAAAVVFFTAAVFFTAVVFVAVAFAAVVFFVVFSAIRRSLSLLHHRECARDAPAGGR